MCQPNTIAIWNYDETTPKQTRNAITKATGNHYPHSPLVEKLLNYYQMDSLLCSSMKIYILFSDAIWFAANISQEPAGSRAPECMRLDCSTTLNITLISPCRASAFHLA